MGAIRLLLAIFIVIAHGYPLFGYTNFNSILAVRAFYVISGFYMTLILCEKYVGKSGSYFLFLSNRLLRIFPTYWLILFITIFLSYLWYYHGLHNAFEDYYQYHNTYSHYAFFLYATPWDIIRDITILGRTDYTILSDAQRQPLLIIPAWTLVLELTFYIIAPFIVKNFKQVMIFLTGSVLLRYIILTYCSMHHMPLPHRFFLSELMYFLFGALAYYLYKNIKQLPIRHKIIRNITFFFIAFTVIYSYLPINIHIKDIFYILLLCAIIPFIFMFSKKSKIDRYIGELSYPVYLSHSIIIVAILNAQILTTNKSLFVCLTILVTIIVSFIIVRYFEQPIEKWRQARVRKSVGSKR